MTWYMVVAIKAQMIIRFMKILAFSTSEFQRLREFIGEREMVSIFWVNSVLGTS